MYIHVSYVSYDKGSMGYSKHLLPIALHVCATQKNNTKQNTKNNTNILKKLKYTHRLRKKIEL